MTTSTLTANRNSLDTANASLNEVKGQKATMLIQNSMGCVVVRHITLGKDTNVSTRRTGWIEKTVFALYYAMKGCRKIYGYKIAEENLVVIAKGWQTPEGMKETSKGQFGFDNWECFDNASFESVKAQLSEVVYCYGN